MRSCFFADQLLL